jgi:hypothetical protein
LSGCWASAMAAVARIVTINGVRMVPNFMAQRELEDLSPRGTKTQVSSL